MKKLLFCLAVLLSTGEMVQSQTMSTIHWYERRPDLYYWGSNWVDSSLMAYPYEYLYSECIADEGYDQYFGRACVTTSPLKVIGIAAPISISYYHQYSYMLDGTSIPVPEYFQLYQHEGDSIFFVDEVRWDTTTPQYMFEIKYGHDSVNSPIWGTFGYDKMETYKLYEAYFDKPIIVHDTFYVGGTTHGNVHYVDEDGNDWWGTVGPLIGYPYLMSGNDFYGHSTIPNPSYHIKKYFQPTFANGKPCGWNSNPLYTAPCFDTSIFYYIGWDTNKYGDIGYRFWPFFAIFDTSFVPGAGTYDESCLAPTSLHLEAINDAGVILAWNAGGESQWQVAVAAEGVNMNDGLLITTPINYVTIEDLEQGHWYTAQVRALCEGETYGDWSAQIQFWYGDPNDSISCATPVGLQVVSTGVGSAVLQWANNPEMLKWQVEYGTAATPVGSGTLVNAPVSFTALNGLDMEAWHWLRVRAYCASDWTSLWTDTVMFYVPGDGSGPDTTTVIDMVEMYTYLMPNPAKEEVTVMSSFKVRSVELYAADGKLLKEQEVNAIGTRLSLEGLPAGVYFVRVRTSAGVTTKRLVVGF